MEILRTPDARFENLPDYDFAPSYTVVRDADGAEIRIHHVDVGPKDAQPILLMHGNPTWAYLYRKMIPALAATGRRVIAVDLVGCGRSDKPSKKSDYTLARHYDWMSKWLEAMDLSNITLFCQDWGARSAFTWHQSTRIASIASLRQIPACPSARARATS